jgi:chromosome segregation ATPase
MERAAIASGFANNTTELILERINTSTTGLHPVLRELGGNTTVTNLAIREGTLSRENVQQLKSMLRQNTVLKSLSLRSLKSLSLRSLEESVSRLEEQLEQRNEERGAVRAELVSRDAEAEQLRAPASRVEELDEKLLERRSQFETLQSDITAKEEEIQKLQDAQYQDASAQV